MSFPLSRSSFFCLRPQEGRGWRVGRGQRPSHGEQRHTVHCRGPDALHRVLLQGGGRQRPGHESPLQGILLHDNPERA